MFHWSGDLQFQRLSPSSWLGAWWCADNMVLATSWSKGNRKWTVTLACILNIGNLKAHSCRDTLPPTGPHPFLYGHTTIVPLPMKLWGQLQSNYHSHLVDIRSVLIWISFMPTWYVGFSQFIKIKLLHVSLSLISLLYIFLLFCTEFRDGRSTGYLNLRKQLINERTDGS